MMARPNLPIGLLGMLTLVAAIEAAERRHSEEFNDYVAQSWRYAAEAASRGAAGAEILCFGDSLVKVGVLPDLLREKTGRSGFNLAIFGGQAPSSYFLLRQAIESGAKPKALIVDFHGNLLAAAPRSSVPYWSDLASPKDLLDLFLETGDIEATFRTVLAMALPSIIDRGEIRSAIGSALSGNPWLSRDERRAEIRNWFVHRGAHLTPVASPGSFDLAPDPPGPVIWHPNPTNEHYLRRFLALARDREIPVFWLIPPTSRPWNARRVRIGIEPAITRFARSILTEFPNLVVVDGRDSGYPDVLFRDLTHLNRVGSAGMTMALARVVSARLDRPESTNGRWVSLPGFVEPPGHWNLEDVDQSALVLRAIDATRR